MKLQTWTDFGREVVNDELRRIFGQDSAYYIRKNIGKKNPKLTTDLIVQWLGSGLPDFNPIRLDKQGETWNSVVGNKFLTR